MTSDDQAPDPAPGGIPAPDPAPGAGPGAIEPPAPPTAAGAVAPGGIYIPDGTASLRPQRRRRTGPLAVAAAGIVTIAALFLKFGLPILVGTALSGVLGTAFGGPFEKLPQDQQQALERRFDAAVGETLKGLSDEQTGDRIGAMITSGLPRLGDELLVDKIQLTSKLLAGASEADCARIARATASGGDAGSAINAALGTLDAPSIGRWFEINISAIEADAAKSPAVRTVDQAAWDRVSGTMMARFTETETGQIGSLYNGGQVVDADACNAFRALYRHIDELPAADLALAALYDVTP